jgi:SAM-dependent methyltransferase
MNINAVHLETGADELERLALEECFKRKRHEHAVSVFVTPAGKCELAAKFARMGASVDVADQAERRQDIEGRILASGSPQDIHFVGATLSELAGPLAGEPYDIVFIRRGLCTLPYPESRRIVRQMLQRLKIGGRIYLSTLGLHSELGDGYTAIDQPVTRRFGPLSPAMARKYGIPGDICLYTERDLFMLLLESGASVLRTMTTSYGSVKAVGGRV